MGLLIVIVASIVGIFAYLKIRKKAKPPNVEEKYEFSICFPVAGIFMPGRVKAGKEAYRNQRIILQKEPDNKHDSNAIKVMSSEGMLGYVPANMTKEIGPILERKHVAIISEIEERETIEYGKEKVFIEKIIVVVGYN
jgi:hypothetical protein